MPPQPDKATLPAFGVPTAALDELELSGLKSSVSPQEASRVSSAASNTFYVFPRAPDMYIVSSVEEGKVQNTYQVNLRSTAACSCNDFLFRCTTHGIHCKHIWRVRLLVKLECLPGTNDDPFSWFVSELYKDKQWLAKQEIDTSEAEQQIDELESDVTMQGREHIDYQTSMRERARIMMRTAASSL